MAREFERFQQNAFDIFGSCSTVGRNDKIMSFLPKIVSNNQSITIKNMSITTSGTDKGPVHNYTVTWTEPTSKSMRKWRDEYIGHVSMVDKSSRSVNSLKSVVKSDKSTRSLRTPVYGKFVRCDGPCRNEVPISSVVQYGCDHLICDGCRKSQKSAVLFDGSPGCCQVDCVQMAGRCGEKLRSGPALSSRSSVTSLNGPFESVQVHISILKKLSKNVVKTQLVYEFSCQSRVSSLPNTLYHFSDLLKESRVYYCFQKPEHRYDLYPISLLDTNLRFYDLMDQHRTFSPELYIAIVGKGICL